MANGASRFMLVMIGGVVFLCGSCKKSGPPGLLAMPTIRFAVGGVASCTICTNKEVPVTGMQVEVFAKGDRSKQLALKSLPGLGPFSIENIQAPRGTELDIMGTLFLEGSAEPTTIVGFASAEAPDEDGDAVALELRFPSEAGTD